MSRLVDISKLGLNSKIKKFSYSFICGKGYSPPFGGENSFLSTVCDIHLDVWAFSNSIYFACEVLRLLAAQVYTPENALYPPSTGSTMPVTKLAARSSTRKSIAPISSLSSP